MCSDRCNFVGASVICAGDANINFTRPQFEFCSILVLDNAIVNLHFPQFTMLEEDKVTDGVSMFVSGQGQLFVHKGRVDGGSHGVVADGGGRVLLDSTNLFLLGIPRPRCAGRVPN